MKSNRLLIVAALLLALAAPLVWTASAESPVHLNNRLRLGYDDNIYQVGDPTESVLGKKSSFRIIEELELLLSLNMKRTYLGLRYRPSLTWYQDREPENTDFLHDLDFNFSQDFTPNLVLSLADTLSAGQLPELRDENYIVREKDDHYHNSAVATLSYNIRPMTRLDLSGRHILFIYDDDSEAKKNNDYNSVIGGLTLRQGLASRTTLMGDLRYQTLTYDEDADNNRDADTLFAGAGVEQNFNPALIGTLRAGVENRMYDNADYDDNTQPYGEVSLTFLPTPATRFTTAASYSIYESDVDAYLSQDRAYLSLSFAHDFTTKLNFYLSGAYSLSSYDSDYALEDALGDGKEHGYMVSARLAYRINRINWIETGWQYSQLESDLQNRESYVRNRVDIGWKIQLF